MVDAGAEFGMQGAKASIGPETMDPEEKGERRKEREEKRGREEIERAGHSRQKFDKFACSLLRPVPESQCNDVVHCMNTTEKTSLTAINRS